jgi:hypothetical protein
MIVAALTKARWEGCGWRCRCPVHDGVNLVFASDRDGGLLIKTWGGGCNVLDILAELPRRRLSTGRSDGAPPILLHLVRFAGDG